MAANGRTDRFDRGPANDRNRRDFATHLGLGEGQISTNGAVRVRLREWPDWGMERTRSRGRGASGKDRASHLIDRG